jgi:ribosomal protein S6--L-glutamate ligase
MRNIGLILSFHPLYDGDRNILCAGRDPAQEELSAIQSAAAVILPQGCRESLYTMARENNRHVFPNYDKRFEFPDKIGQARLFQQTGVPHPRTRCYASVAAFFKKTDPIEPKTDFPFPFVFKFDWGGEGDNVFLVKSPFDFKEMIKKAISYENTGQYGFLIQEFIPCRGRSLRVVVINTVLIAYWRSRKNPDAFHANIKKGARVETVDDPLLQKAAKTAALSFCEKTHINLAGFDFLFSEKSLKNDLTEPLFLEINYFFGRKGLGGSEAYYKILQQEIDRWINYTINF